MIDLVLIAHNLRSTHNVGSLLRTADGLGITTVYLTGYTPYPSQPGDTRLPHIATKINQQINKTALGAETSVQWQHAESIDMALSSLKQSGYTVIALEQTQNSISLPEYQPPSKLAIIVGREVEGIEPAVLAKVDSCVQIPMFGSKESYNVVQAAAMALYHCRFKPL